MQQQQQQQQQDVALLPAWGRAPAIDAVDAQTRPAPPSKRRRVRLVSRLRPFAGDDTPLMPPPSSAESPLGGGRAGGPSSFRFAAASIDADTERGTVTVVDPMSASNPAPQEFRCDKVLGMEATNADVFAAVVGPAIDGAIKTLEGSPPNTVETLCFLAYGQTGSGKTHSIFGELGAEPGLIDGAVRAILARSGGVPIVASFIEIYETNMYDLLAGGTKRTVRRHQAHGCYVPELVTVRLGDHGAWEAQCEDAIRLRRTGKSSVNSRSSRSHAIVTLRCGGLRVCFVDLAGSERQEGMLGDALPRESVMINKSLAVLSRVIQQLAAGLPSPTYRDSLLTVLLERYLSGSSSTTFLCCLHPSATMLSESLSTLRYGSRLKGVTTLGPVTAPSTPLGQPGSPTRSGRGSLQHRRSQSASNVGRRVGDAANASSSSPFGRDRDAAEVEEKLKLELARVREQASRIQAAQRDAISKLEEEVQSLRDSSATATPTASADVSRGTIDFEAEPPSRPAQHRHSDPFDDNAGLNDTPGPTDLVIPMSTEALPYAGAGGDGAQRGRALQQQQQQMPAGSATYRSVSATSTVAPSSVGQRTPRAEAGDGSRDRVEGRSAGGTPPPQAPQQQPQPPPPQHHNNNASLGSVGSTARSSSVNASRAATTTADAAAMEEARTARLLQSWFTRRGAALKNGALPPALPSAELLFDDYFDAVNGPTREALGYMVVKKADAAAANPPPHPSRRTYFAALPVTRELYETGGTGDDGDDAPGELAATLVNVLRWGLPPLLPLHPADGVAPCSLSLPAAPVGNPYDGRGDGDDGSSVLGQIIVAVDLAPSAIAAARVKSWACDCVPCATASSPVPYALVIAVNPFTSGAAERRWLMREVLAVEDFLSMPSADSSAGGSPLPPSHHYRSSPPRSGRLMSPTPQGPRSPRGSTHHHRRTSPEARATAAGSPQRPRRVLAVVPPVPAGFEYDDRHQTSPSRRRPHSHHGSPQRLGSVRSPDQRRQRASPQRASPKGRQPRPRSEEDQPQQYAVEPPPVVPTTLPPDDGGATAGGPTDAAPTASVPPSPERARRAEADAVKARRRRRKLSEDDIARCECIVS